MSKITLNNVTTFQNDTTAANIVDTNNATIVTAFDNTLSRDGTSPNQMGANLDMNSNRILNLPAPSTAQEPLRFGDVNATGLVYSGGTNINVGGTVISTTANPTFATSVTTPQIINAAGSILIPATGTVTIPGATDTVVVRNSVDTLTNKTLTAPVISSITNTGTLTLPTSTDTLVGRATTDTFTNKTFDTGGTGNSLKIGGVAVTRGQIVGTATNDNATAGNIGEFLTASGSGVAMSSGNGWNACSLTLTPGDWDVWGYVGWTNAGTTTYTMVQCSISPTNSVISSQMFQMYVTTAGATYVLPPPMQRISLSATTTYFLVGNQTFTGGSPTGSGTINARRVR
jgi:hypothetical protein